MSPSPSMLVPFVVFSSFLLLVQASSLPPSPIPQIDISSLLSPQLSSSASRSSTSAAILSALEHPGLFYATNCGVLCSETQHLPTAALRIIKRDIFPPASAHYSPPRRRRRRQRKGAGEQEDDNNIDGGGVGTQSSSTGVEGQQQQQRQQQERQQHLIPTDEERSLGVIRGYLPPFSESGYGSLYDEVKEAYSYGYDGFATDEEDGGGGGGGGGAASPPPSLSRLEGYNKYPSGDPEWTNRDGTKRFVLNRLLLENEKIAKTIVRAAIHEIDSNLIKAVDVDGGSRISLVRVFHYLPCGDGAGEEEEEEEEEPTPPPPSQSSLSSAGVDAGGVVVVVSNTEEPPPPPSSEPSSPPPPPRRRLGSSPHTDWGAVTVIVQDSSPSSLSYYDVPTSSWVSVPPVPGTVVINGGDFLSLLTGGRTHSPIHKVDHCSVDNGAGRVSIVYFFYPGFNTLIPDYGRRAGRAERNPDGKKGDKAQLLDGKYNTLLAAEDDDDDDDDDVKTFGQWIAKKWRAVQTPVAGANVTTI